MGVHLPCEIEKRYSLSPVPWHSTFNFSTISEGNSSCDPTFFFDIKKASDDFRNVLNGERAHWNHADDKAFFLGSNVQRLTFYDGDADKNGFVQFSGADFFPGAASIPGNWNKNITEIRWHPTEDAIIYARQRFNGAGTTVIGGELVKRSVTYPTANSVALGTPQVLFYFAGYTISSESDGYNIAGGDGNDVNAGRLLLSLVDISNPSANDQYAVYDFDEDGIVDPTINAGSQSYTETFLGEGAFSGGLFSLYADDTHFDYATVSASGLFVIARYTRDDTNIPATPEEGLTLFDLDGNIVQRNVPGLGLVNRLHRNRAGHWEAGFFRTQTGAIKECVVLKVSSGSMNNSGDLKVNDYLDDGTNSGTTPSIETEEGDIIAVYWDIEVSGGNIRHVAQARIVLDWHQDANADESGGQFSLSSLIQTNQTSIFASFTGLDSYPFRGLLCLKPVNLNSPPFPIYRYYGEIVELSLDESDPIPRRILHHRVILEGSGNVQYQPEAWFSRRGEKFFFKSHHGLLGSDQDLYFVELPLRTCRAIREPSMLRQSASESMVSPSFSLAPNPLRSGGKLWLESDATTPETASASLRLISLDGRRIELWRGSVETGQRIQTVLPEVSAGIYVLELVDHLSNRRLYQEKVLVR
ncbi:MAG: hypothetical protein AAF399_06240 [Bacteroidota bacterium]